MKQLQNNDSQIGERYRSAIATRSLRQCLLLALTCLFLACGNQKDIDYFLLKANNPDHAELLDKAEAGDDDAMLKLGRMCYNGEGLKKDYETAVILFEQLVANDNPYGKYMMGVCYEDGNGKEKDTIKATELFEEAFKEIKPMADEGNAQAQLYIGRMYGNGFYVSKNIEEAAKWFRKAAEQGYADAQCNLGVCYQYGNGVTQSHEEAVKWYRKAAEQGDARSQCNYGWCYETGNGVSQSYEEAVKWYRKAAEQGDAYAQYNLGLCYESGHGVTKSITEAVKWYRKAAEQGEANAKAALKRLGK